MKCTACDGATKTLCFVDYFDGSGECGYLPCQRCHGTGEIDDRCATWQQIGESLRKIRIGRGETLRKMSVRVGIKASKLSAWEGGYEDPSGHPDYEETKF